MLESNVDLEVILGKVPRKMSILYLNNQHAPIPRKIEDVERGRGLFVESPPNVRNVLNVSQVWRDEKLCS